jgi:hypothetical protein
MSAQRCHGLCRFQAVFAKNFKLYREGPQVGLFAIGSLLPGVENNDEPFENLGYRDVVGPEFFRFGQRGLIQLFRPFQILYYISGSRLIGEPAPLV